MKKTLEAVEPTRMEDWVIPTMPQTELQMTRQTTISDWTGKAGVRVVQVIQKTSQKRRLTGKLTKKEQRMMKKTHKDIGWML